jgi:hypothetical protein
VASGELARSIKKVFHQHQDGTTGVVETDKPYALPVEHGVGNMRTVRNMIPPVGGGDKSGIAAWAKKMGWNPWAVIMGRIKKTRGNKVTKPTYFMIEALKNGGKGYLKDLRKIIKQGVSEVERGLHR